MGVSMSALRVKFEPEFDVAPRSRVEVLVKEEPRQQLSDFIVSDGARPVVLFDFL
jgi:hypothetical protein